MSAESPRHVRSGGPLLVPSQPPSDRSIIDAVSGFINDVTLSSSSNVDPKDVIQWARFETADINEPTPEGDSDNDISPLLLILGYGSGVQVWLIPQSGEAQEVLSWRQGTVRVLRILPTPQHGDCFASKRPLIALCDSASPGPTFCSLSFISIRGGEQVKSIKFKNPILDVLANKRSVVVSFSERFAVFDAATLEDRLAVTTCFPCPCPLGGSSPINPIALGDRWLAYADKKLNPSKRSSGGCEGEGVTSYTATVLHAAKSLSKGLRGLGESVAHSLAGGRSTSQSPSPPHADVQQPGVVTILDIEGNEEEDGQESEEPCDPIVAHFVAHSEAIIALKFDPSGMLLVTADRRGHDFHVFRINPHPFGPTLASVHHLYILHRGDTTAKVQDIAISADSRWTAISTLRGTTHVFAVSPYGGACGVRTHTQPRVVNRLSRFQRSAGLPIHSTAPAHSPVCEAGWATPVGGQGAWYPNPRLPPFPAPTITPPLAQLRPTTNLPTHTITRNSSGRQRLSSLSEENSSAPLLARVCFGVGGGGTLSSVASTGVCRGASISLYLMAASGSLLHLVLHPRAARNVPKEKICDSSLIELEVEHVAQWPLQRPPAAADLLAPLPPSNPLLQPLSCRRCADMCMSEEERWLSQVEIVTHAGPHRRLWMGPQFVFKTYNCTGSNSSLSEAETVEVDTTSSRSAARSTPVNMPGVRPIVPVLIDSGSASSLEHSPSDSFRRKSLLAESGRAASVCDVQLKEDLAEAMKEEHGWPREQSREPVRRSPGIVRAVDPLGTVVVPPEEAFPAPLDPDAYTTSNADEATFRPVVRAPASLPLQPNLVLRPLPRTTTIPVQNVSPVPHLSPEDEPVPLNMDVVIPAALTGVEDWLSSQKLYDSSGINVPDPVHRETKSATICLAEVQGKINSVNVVEDSFSKDLDREESACECDVRTSTLVKTELECKVETKALPKSNRAPDDIQPSVRIRSKKSPTTKSVSEKVTSEVSANDKININDKIKVSNEPEKDKRKDRKDVKSKGIRESKNVQDDKISKEVKKYNEFGSDKNDQNKTPPRHTDDTKETKDQVTLEQQPKTLEKEATLEIGQPKRVEQIQERSVKNLQKGFKSDSDKRATIIGVKNEQTQERSDKDLKKLFKSDPNKQTPIIEMKNEQVQEQYDKNLKNALNNDSNKEAPIIEVKNEPHVGKKNSFTNKSFTETECADYFSENIKTEDQAWDMLLSDGKISAVDNSSLNVDKMEESKVKLKKNRKNRKAQDDNQTKEDDDSFVEIHAIEDKKQNDSEELVSISTPFEEIESSLSFLSKAKKPRAQKANISDAKTEYEDVSFDDKHHRETKFKGSKKSYLEKDESDTLKEYDCVLNNNETSKEFKPLEIINMDASKEQTYLDDLVSCSKTVKDTQKVNKQKSTSSAGDIRKLGEKSETETKEVYVINTTEEDYPNIQITRGSRARKKSPQPSEVKKVDNIPTTEKPIKSWSSIAASKNINKYEESDIKLEIKDEVVGQKKVSVREETSLDGNQSFQDKLFELCKRTDIIVAECGPPSELNFLEEHHSALHELPPLEGLEFGLDDFKLEVMKDSLLEVADAKTSSPICKINIDDILSSIKETTSKVIESSSFNLIDVEKVPGKKEKGFSVIETDVITTQEVKINDDIKSEREIDMIEKSSDDDVTSPVLSTDSDKDEKKGIVASDLTLPSAKQSKSKKSRRKKK